MAISGHDPRDPGSLKTPVPDCVSGLEDGIKGLKVGFSMDLGHAYLNDDVARVTEEALKGLEDAGASVSTVDVEFRSVSHVLLVDYLDRRAGRYVRTPG